VPLIPWIELVLFTKTGNVHILYASFLFVFFDSLKIQNHAHPHLTKWTTLYLQFSFLDVVAVNTMRAELDEFSNRGKELKGRVR
jgi:hypothetical protein